VFFRNLLVYRLPADWSLSPVDLEEKLLARQLQPVGHFDLSSRGWVVQPTSQRLAHAVGLQQMLTLGIEQRLLPASIIRQVAEERAKELEAEQGFPVGRRQLRDLRQQVGDELRAKALVRRTRTRAWLDPERGWFGVDSASAKRAEELVDTLRDTLGSFGVVPLDPARSPQATMAAWLLAGEAPAPFRIDDELELRAVAQSRAVVRYLRHPVAQDELRRHLADGLLPTRLGLTWRDRLSFVLTDKLELKRLQFVGLEDAAVDSSQEDAAEQFDAGFLLMAGELGALLADLAAALDAGAGTPEPVGA
jgi:recombination associated protein RdgC